MRELWFVGLIIFILYGLDHIYNARLEQVMEQSRALSRVCDFIIDKR